jgi:hypothetical protein
MEKTLFIVNRDKAVNKKAGEEKPRGACLGKERD